MPERHPFHHQFATELPALRRFAVSLTHNQATAQDLVQETLLKAWANRTRFEQGSCLRAWLFTILRNTFLTDRRKGAHEIADVDGLFAAQLAEAPRQDDVVALSELHAALQTLPASQRESLVLVGGAGFSHEEVARLTGCAVGTVKSRINRARNRLAELLLSPDEAQPGRSVASPARRGLHWPPRGGLAEGGSARPVVAASRPIREAAERCL